MARRERRRLVEEEQLGELAGLQERGPVPPLNCKRHAIQRLTP